MKLGIQAQLNLLIKVGQEKNKVTWTPTLLYPTNTTFPFPNLKVNLKENLFSDIGLSSLN